LAGPPQLAESRAGTPPRIASAIPRAETLIDAGRPAEALAHVRRAGSAPLARTPPPLYFSAVGRARNYDDCLAPLREALAGAEQGSSS